MNMDGACWMRRSLEEPVSALLFDSYNNLIAGGWNGCLSKWSADGDEIWGARLPDRVSSIAVTEKYVFATSGLHLVAVDNETGSVIWQHALEGSADQVIIHNERIITTSSVYDIEHNDFIDSAIWCYDDAGKKHWETHLDERPWVILGTKDKLFVGLGRPKMGAAVVNDDGSLEYLTLESDSPVTAGTESSSGVVFGHSNGDLTKPSEPVRSGNGQSISAICSSKEGALVVCDASQVTKLNSSNQIEWAIDVIGLSAVAKGFPIEGNQSVWLGIQDGINGILHVISQADGAIISTMHCGKINCITGNANRVALGDEKGDIFVWEDAMLNRRFGDDANVEDDGHRQSMRDKLKALRKR